MKSKNDLLLTLLLTFLPFVAICQNFEGILYYENYNVQDSDTTASSTSRIWIKNHLYKHRISYSKNPLLDLGTLYADASKMSRISHVNGKIERIPPSIDAVAPNLELARTNKSELILGHECQVWDLINTKTSKVESKLWVSDGLINPHFDQFVEIFNYSSTHFPIKGISGWILKREDYRRVGKTFVTELKQLEKQDLSVAEMVIY